jgi:hypothetical protein
MFDITTKLEVNINPGPTLVTDVTGLSTFLIKYRIPTLVTDPLYLMNMLIEKEKIVAPFRVICTMDFDRGNRYGLDKLRPLPNEMKMADGYDILLSPGRTDKETLNEIRVLHEFIKQVIAPIKEIRWTLGLRTRTQESVKYILAHIKEHPANFIRTNVALDSSNQTLEKHLEDIEMIKKNCPTPIIISGGVNLKIIRELSGKVARFDVSVTQAKQIVNEALHLGDKKPEDKKPEDKKPGDKAEKKPEELKKAEDKTHKV